MRPSEESFIVNMTGFEWAATAMEFARQNDRLMRELDEAKARSVESIKVIGHDSTHFPHTLGPHSLTLACFDAGCKPVELSAERMLKDLPL